MARAPSPAGIGVGDWMPRITLPLASGTLFDSADPATAGFARVYWVGTPTETARLADALMACETLLHTVVAKPFTGPDSPPSCLVDRMGELGRAFGVVGPLAVVVDPAGRIRGLLQSPTVDQVIAAATMLYRATTPVTVRAKAPVLLLEEVLEPDFRQALIDYWHRSEKLANRVGSSTGNVVNDDVKRRQDVQVDDPTLFARLRDCLVRRVTPAMVQAFHADIRVIEAPIVGCYDSGAGGWFNRHRDNTSELTAHRQFALTLNLNADDEYDGGEVRFAEFGRELYRPSPGGAVVFSTSLLHEVIPVTRGRRFGVFTFLSNSGPDVRRSPPSGGAPQRARLPGSSYA
ncbi:hypothetical protein BH11PSE3_BH11PSE3_44870 [soil metagenome]